MLDLVADLFLAIVIPASLTSAAVIVLASWKLGWRGMEIVVPAAVAAGLLVGNWRRASIPYLPGDFGWEWILACAAGALLVAVFLSFASEERPRLRGALHVVPLLLFTFLLLPADWRSPLTLWAFAVVAGLNTAALATSRPSHPAVVLVVACGILGGASLVLICASFAKLSDAAVLLSASLAGLLVASRRPMPLMGLSLMVGTLVPGLMLNGYFQTYSQVPWLSFALVAVAPMFFFIGKLRPIRRGPAWRRTMLEVALPLIAVGAGLALAVAAEGLGGGDAGDDEPETQSPAPPSEPETPAGPEPVR